MKRMGALRGIGQRARGGGGERGQETPVTHLFRPVHNSLLPPPMRLIHPRAHDNYPHHCPNHPSIPTLSPNPVRLTPVTLLILDISAILPSLACRRNVSTFAAAQACADVRSVCLCLAQ